MRKEFNRKGRKGAKIYREDQCSNYIQWAIIRIFKSPKNLCPFATFAINSLPLCGFAINFFQT